MGYTCYYTFEGVTYKNLMDMCRRTGRNAQRVRMRLAKGMSLDEAMSLEKKLYHQLKFVVTTWVIIINLW